MALAACSLPPGAVQPEDIEILQVGVTHVTGLDARGRLPEMAQQLDAIIGGLDYCEPDMVAVEAQAHRRGDPRPDNIVQLAVVEGIAGGLALSIGAKELRFPLPVDWKGSIPKAEHQKRLLRRLGLTTNLNGVDGADQLKATHRSHVLDAIGLAVWGLGKLVFDERKLRALA